MATITRRLVNNRPKVNWCVTFVIMQVKWALAKKSQTGSRCWTSGCNNNDGRGWKEKWGLKKTIDDRNPSRNRYYPAKLLLTSLPITTRPSDFALDIRQRNADCARESETERVDTKERGIKLSESVLGFSMISRNYGAPC